MRIGKNANGSAKGEGLHSHLPNGRGAVCISDRNLDAVVRRLVHCLIARVDILNLNRWVTACPKARLRDRPIRQKAEILLVSNTAPININLLV